MLSCCVEQQVLYGTTKIIQGTLLFKTPVRAYLFPLIVINEPMKYSLLFEYAQSPPPLRTWRTRP